MDSTLPAAKLAKIRAPSRLFKVGALKLQIKPPRNMSMEMRITGRFPMHMASGIQKRLPTPRAKTDQEVISVRGPKPTRNSIARASYPVVIPDYYS
jgi:hypothetical protein